VFCATLTFRRRRSPAKRPFDLEASMVDDGSYRTTCGGNEREPITWTAYRMMLWS
jgi:hypothetical protein